MLKEKGEIFIAAVRKPVRNSSSHQGENERQRKKKVGRNTYHISPPKKHVTRKLLEVSRCSRAKQR